MCELLPLILSILDLNLGGVYVSIAPFFRRFTLGKLWLPSKEFSRHFTLTNL